MEAVSGLLITESTMLYLDLPQFGGTISRISSYLGLWLRIWGAVIIEKPVSLTYFPMVVKKKVVMLRTVEQMSFIIKNQRRRKIDAFLWQQKVVQQEIQSKPTLYVGVTYASFQFCLVTQIYLLMWLTQRIKYLDL